jgi:cytochrome b561
LAAQADVIELARLGWARGQRRLHWWTATMIAAAFALAWVMVAVPLEQLLLKFVLYQAHKTLGLLVLACVLARLAWRARRCRPDWEPDLSAVHRRAAAAGHALLYALALLVPVLGYLTAGAAPGSVPTLFLFVLPVPNIVGSDPALFAVLRPLHRAAAILLVACALAHAGFAFYQHRRGGLTLRRMWRGA